MRTFFVITALVIAAVSRGAAGDGGPAPAAPLPEVGIITLKPENVTITQELNGRVTPFLIAEVRPQVNGIILRRIFDEGADVREGDPLYQIDPSVYEADYNRAIANLGKARANVEVANTKLRRYDRLIQARAVNQQEYDEVAAAAKQAEADVGIAEADVKRSKINLDYALLVSPISGRIGKSSVTQGALVTASQPDPLATVQRLDPIYVDVSQPVSGLIPIRRGLRRAGLENNGESHAAVKLILDSGETYEHAGKLLFADVTVDQSTGSISLRAEFPNPGSDLLPGMYVRAVLDMAEIRDAVTVPQRAVARNAAGEASVLVVRGDDTVERRSVAVIRAIGEKWLVGDGLAGGERVIVDGSQRVRITPNVPNPKVKPVATDAEPAGTGR